MLLLSFLNSVSSKKVQCLVLESLVMKCANEEDTARSSRPAFRGVGFSFRHRNTWKFFSRSESMNP